MEITEVRIKLMEDPQERLQAFCSITFDGCFVVRDLKIIEGIKGSFVAMPSRKLTDHCPKCHAKNHLRSCYCNQCGIKLHEDRATKDEDGRAKLYADIAHPINSRCREMIQTRVLESFREEQIHARLPDYVCRYDDYGEENYATLSEDARAEPPTTISIGQPDSMHRIESGEQVPSTPHSAPEQTTGKKDSITITKDADNEEEGFGAGIL